MTISKRQIIALNGVEYIGGVRVGGQFIPCVPDMGDEIEFKSGDEILTGEVTEVWYAGSQPSIEVSVY